MNEKPGQLYLSIIEPHSSQLDDTWQDIDQFCATIQTLPLKVVNLYAAEWCQIEVRNGGLYQFFYNTTGILAPEAVRAFREIGIPEWSAVVAEAMSHFGDTYPRKRRERQQQLPAKNTWDKLDEKFYGWLADDYYRWHKVANEYAAT